MPFVELKNGWKYTRDIQGATGRREFRADPDGYVAALPVLGDMFDDPLGADSSFESIFTTCRLRKITKVYPREETDDNPHFILEYRTPNRSAGVVGGAAGTAGEYEAMRASGEVVVLEDDDESGHTWVSTSDKVDQPIGKIVVNTTWTVRENFLTRSAAVSGVRDILYHINAGGSSPGCWLFVGIDLDEGIGDDGAALWRVARNYAFRMVEKCIDSSRFGFELKGWNYLWNKNANNGAGGWDLTDPVLYSSATLIDQYSFPW
jgi:hypothetical protein